MTYTEVAKLLSQELNITPDLTLIRELEKEIQQQKGATDD